MNELIDKLRSSEAVISMLPELPGYNGSVLIIDDDEAERIASDIGHVATVLTNAIASVDWDFDPTTASEAYLQQEIRRISIQLAAEREISDKLEKALNEINNWLVCAAIATPDDMAQSFQPMQQLADAALAEVEAIRAKQGGEE